MAEVSSLVSKDGILMELKSTSREAVREEMVDHLITRGVLPADLRDSVLEGLINREEKMTTAIGDGLSLPHTAVTGLGSVVTMVAFSKAGIDCDSLDQQPVFLFFMILVPDDQYALHLRTLALVAKFFTRPGVRDRLLAAKTPDEVFNLFQE